ncbi:MAG: hypothetical protein KatS3mg076_0869 [Candidatus Binatia bacterium]|nr:MAG: hypothetical protein KatS3mg076_0869 [Candidatus Binatia bacterium]
MPQDLAEKRAAYVRELEAALAESIRILSSIEEVERVSVFGSYARGKRDLLTDLDLLVVMRTEMPFLERLGFLYGRLALPVDADIFSYTPEELRSLAERPFFRTMLRDEVVLYEKGPV